MMIRVMDEVYERASGADFMPKRDYTIDRELMDRWVANIQEHFSPEGSKYEDTMAARDPYGNIKFSFREEDLKVIPIFARHLYGYSRAEFNQAAIEVAKDAAVYASSYSRHDQEVVLIIPSSPEKSNTWVSMLMWPYIRHVVTDIRENLTDAIVAHSTREGYYDPDAPSVLCLIPDDAMYSGAQMETTIDANVPKRTPWTIGPPARNFEVFVMTPFATQDAKRRASPIAGFFRGNVKYSDRMRRLRTLGEIVAEDYELGDFIEDRFIGGLLKFDQVPAFFSHKLPDNWSVPSEIIAALPFVSIKEFPEQEVSQLEVRGISAIEGCEISDYAFRDGSPYEVLAPISPTFDDIKVCPPSHYRLITYYTHEGTALRYMHFATFLERQADIFEREGIRLESESSSSSSSSSSDEEYARGRAQLRKAALAKITGIRSHALLKLMGEL